MQILNSNRSAEHTREIGSLGPGGYRPPGGYCCERCRLVGWGSRLKGRPPRVLPRSLACSRWILVPRALLVIFRMSANGGCGGGDGGLFSQRADRVRVSEIGRAGPSGIASSCESGPDALN